jgi:hypothetical protein
VDLKSFRGTKMECYSCYKKDDRHEGQEGVKCESCHNDKSWKVQKFDHNIAKFSLLGKHILVECKSCHTSLKFKDAQKDCYSCHKKDDKHKLKFGEKCESCHNQRAWAIWDYNHEVRAGYKLDGSHKTVACESCHKIAAPKGKAAASVGSLV